MKRETVADKRTTITIMDESDVDSMDDLIAEEKKSLKDKIKKDREFFKKLED